MSYYYDYYIGYIDKKDNKIYPYGPYTREDKKDLASVISYSRSFNYDFSELFYEIPEDMYSDELMASNDFKDIYEEKYCVNPKYCKVSELPEGDYIKTGYFLIEDVMKYLEDRDSDVFYNKLDPITYNGMVASELQFGRPGKKLDDYGDEYIPHSAGDYMYFAYPDYNCVEYRAFMIRIILSSMSGYDNSKEFVIIETEG